MKLRPVRSPENAVETVSILSPRNHIPESELGVPGTEPRSRPQYSNVPVPELSSVARPKILPTCSGRQNPRQRHYPKLERGLESNSYGRDALAECATMQVTYTGANEPLRSEDIDVGQFSQLCEKWHGFNGSQSRPQRGS
eukprot:3940844-Rhodomonas_salina.6